MKRTILHLDFDSFFASCEQQYTPALRHKPIGVTAHNGRTAIIAASREAKKKGLKNVMRTYDAFKICPELQLVTADFSKYWEVSQKFVKICSRYSPYVEVFSIDEVFMDVTLTAHLFGGLEQLLSKIKQTLKEEVGEYITISIGVSHNKLLAKLASGLKKPDGIFSIQPNQVEAVYAITPLEEICGIGPRILARLNAIGIYSLLQLRKAPLTALIAEFGPVEGTFLKHVGLGRDDRPVVPYSEAPEAKSVSRQHCLGANEYDRRVVTQELYELCEEIGLKLRRLHKKARAIGFSLRGTEIIHAHTTHADFVNTGKELFTTLMQQVPLTESGTRIAFNGYVRRIGVWAGNLVSEELIQPGLFDHPEKKDKLYQTIDAINDKFGRYTIRNGFLLYGVKLPTVPNGFMADRVERVKLSQFSISET